MYLNWKQRLEQDPSLRKVENWVGIDSRSLPSSKRNKFLRNIKIVAKAANGETLTDVAREFNLTPAAVSILMKRTFAGDSNTPPTLTPALVPRARLRTDRRRSELSSFKKTIGTRCSFGQLLHIVPGLKDYLHDVVLQYVNQAHNGENLTPKTFHQKFIQYLVDQQYPSDKYPFDQLKKGYETCRKYFHSLVAELSMPKPKSRIVRATPSIDRAYEQIQIDSQTLDIQTSAHFKFNGNTSAYRLSRMSLFIAIDVATDCILAYKLCFTESPTQYDLLDLLIGLHKKWKPRNLTTPGLNYEPGACLPTYLNSAFQSAGVGTISLDNALCHHSHSIRDFICNEMGATINYGLPAHPKIRSVVEYAFNRLNHFIHRFSCTTGSHPNDSRKESIQNAKKAPVLSVANLEDILSVVVAHHNNKPQNRLYGHSPLSLIESQMCQRLIRMNHNLISRQSNPYLREKRVKVCWTSKEKRTPYIHFAGLRYTAPGILGVDLIKQEIIIQYDYRDIRTVFALTTKGDKLGILNAPLSWQSCKHSLDTRKYIMGLIRQNLIVAKDPLQGTFEYLRLNRKLPTEALNLTGLIKDVGGVRTPVNDEIYSPHNTHVPRRPKISWKPKVFQIREKP